MSKHIIEALQSNYTTVKVTYVDRGQRYTFKVTNELASTLVVGDLVLVESTQGYLRSVRVESIDAFPDINFKASFAYKWVIQKLDLSEYHMLLAQEGHLVLELEKVQRQQAKEKILFNTGISGAELNRLYDMGKV